MACILFISQPNSLQRNFEMWVMSHLEFLINWFRKPFWNWNLFPFILKEYNIIFMHHNKLILLLIFSMNGINYCLKSNSSFLLWLLWFHEKLIVKSLKLMMNCFLPWVFLKFKLLQVVFFLLRGHRVIWRG